jgi:hypothetical protein
MTINKCKGCGLRIQFGHRKVCKLTPTEITDIKDCPCKICLIKMMCSCMCSNFVNAFDLEYKWRFKVNTVRPIKDINHLMFNPVSFHKLKRR